MQCPLTITGVMHWPLALGDTNLETPLLTTVVTPSKSKSEWQWHEISRFRGYWFQIVTQWCDIMWHSDVRRVWMSNMPAAFYSFCSSFTVSWVWATADSEHRPPQRFSILWQKTESWLASYCSDFSLQVVPRTCVHTCHILDMSLEHERIISCASQMLGTWKTTISERSYTL